MIDTVQILLDKQFVEIQRQDARVVLREPVTASTVATVVATAGVATVEPELAVPLTLVAGTERYATTAIGLVPETTMHAFRAEAGQSVELGEDGLLVGIALRGQLGIDVGDAIELEISGQATTSTIVTGFVDEPLGTYAYGSLATVADAAGLAPSDPRVGSALVRYEPGAERGTVRAALTDRPAVAAVVDSRSLYDTAQQFMGLFYAFIGVMLVLGGVMAFALIFNTMTANVTERAVELTTLRCLGMTASTVGRLVTAENVLLTLVALVPGLAGAYVLAAAFMASFSSDLFRFDLEVRPTTFVGTAAAIVIVALVSQLPALSTVGRLDLGRVVRERAT